MSRMQFVIWMLKEVKEFHIPYIIPQLYVQQPVPSDKVPGETILDVNGNPITNSSAEARPPGIPTGVPLAQGLTVKTEAATPEQQTNGNIILQTGVGMGANRKVLVCSIMTAIQESSITNLPDIPNHEYDSVGVFQQRASMGWPASRNVAVDAAEFFKRAMANDRAHPEYSYTQLCQSVQGSAYPDAYAPWQPQAEQWVNAFGYTGAGPGGTGDVAADPRLNNNSKPEGVVGTGTAAVKQGTNTVGTQTGWSPQTGAGDYQFFRGDIRMDPGGSGNWLLKKQNSWDCIQGLAREINWKAFCVSGTIYFVSEPWLFRSKPFMVISEDSDGIDWIDYDYDEGKRSATINVTCHIHRWSAPPGSTVQIVDMGIPNGKWLVNNVARSLFNDIGTITLKKPHPVLPEPLTSATFGGKGAPTFGQVQPPNVPSIAGPATGVAVGVVEYARQQLGDPYVWGAEGPASFDCSGLTQAAYSTIGVSIPRVAIDQYNYGPKLSVVQELQPGDLVFFSHGLPPSANDVGHVGIYIGGGEMIHAPHTGDVVKISNITGGYYKDHYLGATRPSAKTAASPESVTPSQG
jgi:cell wall-associated NlpC family hydrolase